MSDYVHVLPYAAAVISTLVCSVGLCRVWLGWGARRLYAGPAWDDTRGERLFPVFCSRLGVAACWTVVMVMALLLIGVMSAHIGLAPRMLQDGAGLAWVVTEGWWLVLLVFSLSVTRQWEHIWTDLNTREEEAWQRWRRTQALSRAPGQQQATALPPEMRQDHSRHRPRKEEP